MFIINLTYIKGLELVDQHLEDHKKFLDQYYNEGFFINWGRKNPRTGGIIIAKAQSKKELEKIVRQDIPSFKIILQAMI